MNPSDQSPRRPPSRLVWLLAAALVSGGVLYFVARGGGSGGGGPNPVSVTPDAAPPPRAANESKITRYPDEESLEGTTGMILWAAANARTQTGGAGDLIVTARRGTRVEKLARREGYELIIFTDPSDASHKLMGWISAAVFSKEPPHAPPSAHCDGDLVAVLVAGGGEACVPGVTECTSDTQCSRDWICDGEGLKWKDGKRGKLIQFCRVGVRLPGTTGEEAPAEAPARDGGAPRRR